MTSHEETAARRLARNPFPGLRPYDESESDLFFGRDKQTREVLARLRTQRFLVVTGKSGCGKSSLIRAGVLPQLRDGYGVEESGTWRIATFRPGENPIAHLAAALNAPGVLRPAELTNDVTGRLIQATLRRGSGGVEESLGQAQLPDDCRLLILVDQFEELFRFARDSPIESAGKVARAFVNLLLDAASGESPVYVLLTMRSEFLAACTQFPRLPEQINEGVYLVPRLERDQFRLAICRPIEHANGAIAENLVQELLNDVTDDPDQLPVLQHALMRLWIEWQRSDIAEEIDRSHYETIGGLDSALAQHLDRIYDGHGSLGQQIIEAVYRCLTDVTPDGRLIRRPSKISQIVIATGADFSDVVNVIEAFRIEGRSFLMPPPDISLTEDTVLDISHESLIKRWPRLKEWTIDESRARRVFHMLVESTEEWLNRNRNADYLLTGVRLAEALEWSKAHSFEMSDEQREFLREGQSNLQRETRRRVLSRVMIGAGVLMACAVVVIWQFYIEAQEQRKDAQEQHKIAEKEKVNAVRAGKAEAEQRRLAESEYGRAQAWAFVGTSERGRLAKENSEFNRAAIWSAEALQFATEEADARKVRGQLAASLQQCPNLVQLWWGEGDITKVVFSGDAQRLLIARNDGSARVYDIRSGKSSAEHPIQFSDQKLHIADLNLDGSIALTIIGDKRELRLWDVKSSKMITVPPGNSGMGPTIPVTNVQTASLSPDGNLVATVDDKGFVQAWDIRTGKWALTPSQIVDESSSPASGAAKSQRQAEVPRSIVKFSPDSSLIAASAGSVCRTWHTKRVQNETGHTITYIFGKRFEQRSTNDKAVTIDEIVLSPDGRRLTTRSTNHELQKLWDLKSGTLLASNDRASNQDELDALEDLLESIPPSERERYVERMIESAESSQSLDDLIALRRANNSLTNVADRQLNSGFWTISEMRDSVVEVSRHKDSSQWIWTLDQSKTVMPVVGPNGRLVATATHTGIVRVWNLDREAHRDRNLVLSNSGRYTIQFDKAHAIQVEDLSDGTRSEITLRDSGAIDNVWLGRDDQFLVTHESDNLLVWDLRKAKLLTGIKSIPSAQGVRVWSDHVAVLSEEMTPRLWSIENGVATETVLEDASPAVELLESPSGLRLLARSGDTIRVWDCASGKLAGPVITHVDLMDVDFAPNELHIATAGWSDDSVAVWDVSSGEKVCDVRHEDDTNLALFSSNGQWLVTGSDDGTARICDAITGKQLPNLVPMKHGDWVMGGALSPDMQLLVTVDDANAISLWRTASGSYQTPTFTHDALVVRLHFAGNNRFVTLDVDGTVRLFDLSGNLIDEKANVPFLSETNEESLLRLAQALSGAQLSPGTTELQGLGQEPLSDTWHKLQAYYGSTAQPVVRPVREWYVASLEKYRASNDLTSALWHLDRLIALQPDDLASLLVLRARLFMSIGQKLGIEQWLTDAKSDISAAKKLDLAKYEFEIANAAILQTRATIITASRAVPVEAWGQARKLLSDAQKTLDDIPEQTSESVITAQFESGQSWLKLGERLAEASQPEEKLGASISAETAREIVDGLQNVVARCSDVVQKIPPESPRHDQLHADLAKKLVSWGDACVRLSDKASEDFKPLEAARKFYAEAEATALDPSPARDVFDELLMLQTAWFNFGLQQFDRLNIQNVESAEALTEITKLLREGATEAERVINRLPEGSRTRLRLQVALSEKLRKRGEMVSALPVINNIELLRSVYEEAGSYYTDAENTLESIVSSSTSGMPDDEVTDELGALADGAYNIAEKCRKAGFITLAKHQFALVLRVRKALYQPVVESTQEPLALAWDHVGDVNLKLGMLTEAAQCYKSANEIWQKLALSDDALPRLKFYLALSYEDLCGVNERLGNTAEVKRNFNEIQRLAEELEAVQEPDSDVRENLTDIYKTLARVANYNLDNDPLSYDFWSRVERRQRSAAEEESIDVSGLEDLSLTLEWLADLYVDVGKTQNAVVAGEESVQLQELYLKSEPDDLDGATETLAGRLRWLAEANNEAGYGDATKYQTQAIEKNSLVSEKKPHLVSNIGWRASGYNTIGDFLLRRGNTRNADDSYKKCIELRKGLVDRDHDNLEAQWNLVLARWNQPQLSFEQGKYALTEKLYADLLKQAESIFNNIGEPTVAQEAWLAGLVDDHALAALRSNRIVEARSQFERARKIWESLLMRVPESISIRRDIADFYSRFGNALIRLGETEDGLMLCSEALVLERATVQEVSQDRVFRRSLAETQINLANTLLALAQPDYMDLSVDQLLKDAQSTLEELSEEDPVNAAVQVALVRLYNSLGDAALQQGQASQAISLYKQAMSSCDTLVVKDPENVSAIGHQSHTLAQIGQAELFAGDYEEAQKHLETAFLGYKQDGDVTPSREDLRIQYENIRRLRALSRLDPAVLNGTIPVSISDLQDADADDPEEFMFALSKFQSVRLIANGMSESAFAILDNLEQRSGPDASLNVARCAAACTRAVRKFRPYMELDEPDRDLADRFTRRAMKALRAYRETQHYDVSRMLYTPEITIISTEPDFARLLEDDTI